MILFWGIFFVLAVLLAFCRRMHQLYEMKTFNYKIFALRDRLRRMAIDGKIDPKSFEFHYTDHNFSRNINDSYYITLFRVVVISLRNENDQAQKAFRDKFTQILEQNLDLKDLYNDYYEAFFSYLKGQHWISYYVILRPISTILIGASMLQSKLRSLIQRMIVIQDNSSIQYG